METVATPKARSRVMKRSRAAERMKPPPSFAEVVWAHFQREKALRHEKPLERPYEGPEQELYDRLKRRFEAADGEMIDAYWCSRVASGVALTTKTETKDALNPWKHGTRIKIHRVSDWATKDAPEFAGMLHECDTLAARAREVLPKTPLRVMMQWIFSVVAYLLGVVDNDQKPNEQETRRVLTAYRVEFERMQEYYENAGMRTAQITYVQGMVMGLGVVTAIAFVGTLFGLDLHGVLFACFAAGAAGAFVSVLSRMATGGFRVDYEVGRPPVLNLGSFRPLIGATFGVIAYLALKSKLLMIKPPDETYAMEFYVVWAFLAGFSERLFQDMLGKILPAVKESGRAEKEPEQPGLPGATIKRPE